MYGVLLKHSEDYQRAERAFRRFSLSHEGVEHSPLVFRFMGELAARQALTALEIAEVKAKIIYHI